MDWQEKYALIIDEVGMLGARMLYAVNVQLRRLRESTEDFGDIPVIIFCGDFHQFRPVQDKSGQYCSQAQASHAGKATASVSSSKDNTTSPTSCGGSSPWWCPRKKFVPRKIHDYAGS